MISTAEKQKTLNALDRCDKCGARACVLVSGINGELLFCSHHYNSIMNNPDGYKAMMNFMVSIIDERDKLYNP
jgi:hypothetical protein